MLIINNNRSIFYGWFIAGIGLLNITATYGVMNGFSPIFVAILAEFNVPRASLSGIFSLSMFVMFSASLMAGPLLDRWGPRLVIPTGFLLMGLGLYKCGSVSSPYQLYAFFGLLVAAGGSFAGWMPNTAVVSQWFVRHRGLAVGVVTAGMGLSVFFIPLTQVLIERLGWRSAFWGLALFTVIPGISLNALFQRARPQDIGLLPDGDRDLEQLCQGEQDKVPISCSDPEQWTLRQAVKRLSFWMVSLALFCNPLATFTIMLHAMALVVDRGFDPAYAARFLGFSGLFSVIGRIACGTISDRIGRAPAYSFFMALMAAGVTMLIFLDQERAWILPAYVLIAGLGLGVGAGMFPALIADFFPGSNTGSILGASSVFGGFGSAFGSWFAGYQYDLTGSYTPGFVCVIIAIIGAVIFVWAATVWKPVTMRQDKPDKN